MDLPSFVDQQQHHHLDQASIFAWTKAILWWIVYPIGLILWYLALSLLFIAKPLYQFVAYLSLPLRYLAEFSLAVVSLPIRILAKFETLYIYLGVAALVGLTGGLIVAIIYLWLNKLMGLDRQPPPPAGRTIKQYRDEKRKQRNGADPYGAALGRLSSGLHSPGTISPGYMSLSDGVRMNPRSRNLLASTIMEEQDSDF